MQRYAQVTCPSKKVSVFDERRRSWQPNGLANSLHQITKRLRLWSVRIRNDSRLAGICIVAYPGVQRYIAEQVNAKLIAFLSYAYLESVTPLELPDMIEAYRPDRRCHGGVRNSCK